MFVEIDNLFVNPEQVQIIRQAAPFEASGRQGPVTVLILEEGTRYFVHGYYKDIKEKLTGKLLLKKDDDDDKPKESEKKEEKKSVKKVVSPKSGPTNIKKKLYGVY